MRKTFIGAVVVAVVVALTGCSAGPVTPTVTDPWIKAIPTLADGTATGVFMVINNPGSEAIQLVSATNDTAGLTSTPLEIHEVVMKDGAMVMQQVAGGINVPAKGSVALKPGGYHVMYWDLKQPIPAGSTVNLTLKFSNGTKVPVTATAMTIANAQEKYSPSASPSPSMSMSH